MTWQLAASNTGASRLRSSRTGSQRQPAGSWRAGSVSRCVVWGTCSGRLDSAPHIHTHTRTRACARTHTHTQTTNLRVGNPLMSGNLLWTPRFGSTSTAPTEIPMSVRAFAAFFNLGANTCMCSVCVSGCVCEREREAGGVVCVWVSVFVCARALARTRSRACVCPFHPCAPPPPKPVPFGGRRWLLTRCCALAPSP